ncbi:MAG: aminomethyltransferase family protein, partial [Rhodoplanes sp.]
MRTLGPLQQHFHTLCRYEFLCRLKFHHFGGNRRAGGEEERRNKDQSSLHPEFDRPLSPAFLADVARRDAPYAGAATSASYNTGRLQPDPLAAVLRTTPFHARTAPLCVSHAWRRWAGYVVASAYELTHEREYHAIRSAAAVIDISPLYKYAVSGRDAARLLDRIATRDVARSAPGQVLYTCWCDAAGKVLDDGTIARLGESEFRMTSAEPNLRWLQDNGRDLDVAIEDVSDRIAALALQGPASRAVLEQLVEVDFAQLRFFRIEAATLHGVPVTISRTGYTGDLGYEIWMPAEHALTVWDALTHAGSAYGIVPTGILALDIARIEAGLMLMDVDYVSARKALTDRQTSSPFELD